MWNVDRVLYLRMEEKMRCYSRKPVIQEIQSCAQVPTQCSNYSGFVVAIVD